MPSRKCCVLWFSFSEVNRLPSHELCHAQFTVFFHTAGIARDRYDLLRFNGMKRFRYFFLFRIEGCFFADPTDLLFRFSVLHSLLYLTLSFLPLSLSHHNLLF